MNTDQLEGKWNQIKGNLKEIWGDLTDLELDKMKGGMQEAVGYLQEKYGDTKEAIEEKISDWLSGNHYEDTGDIDEEQDTHDKHDNNR